MPVCEKEWMMTKNQTPNDAQEPRADRPVHYNKTGHQETTQLNQGHRTPMSRSDRESHIGADNQSQERRKPGKR